MKLLGFMLSLVLVAGGIGWLTRPRPIPVGRHQAVLNGPCSALHLKCPARPAITRFAESLRCPELVVVCQPED